MRYVEKGVGNDRCMLPGELASYLGTTTRTLRRWMRDPTFPKPSKRSPRGYKLWTPSESKEVLQWVMKRR